MAVQVEIVGLRQMQVRLGRLTPTLQTQLRIFVAERIIALQAAVKQNIATMLRGGGPLENAVQSSMEETTDSFTGSVFIDGNAIPYAKIQEEGGTTRAHDIFPVNGKALAFMMKGNGYAVGLGSDWKMRFNQGATQNNQMVVGHVKHPGSHIPEHPYARLALYRERPIFARGVRAIVEEAIAT